MHARSPILSSRHASATACIYYKKKRTQCLHRERAGTKTRAHPAGANLDAGHVCRSLILAVHVRLMGIKAPDTKQAQSCIQINKNRLTALAVEVAQQSLFTKRSIASNNLKERYLFMHVYTNLRFNLQLREVCCIKVVLSVLRELFIFGSSRAWTCS